MKTAQPLDGEDLPLSQEFQGFRYRVTGQRLTFNTEQRKLRPAFRATVSFCVKAAIFRPAVFPLTLVA
jgi:hypothetical protein